MAMAVVLHLESYWNLAGRTVASLGNLGLHNGTSMGFV